MLKLKMFILTTLIFLSINSNILILNTLWKSKPISFPKLKIARCLINIYDSSYIRKLLFDSNIGGNQNLQLGLNRKKKKDETGVPKKYEKYTGQRDNKLEVKKTLKDVFKKSFTIRSRDDETRGWSSAGGTRKNENQVGAKMEDKIETQMEDKMETQMEDKMETQMEDKMETQMENKIETQSEDQNDFEQKHEDEPHLFKRKIPFIPKFPIECEDLGSMENVNIDELMKQIDILRLISVSKKKACVIFFSQLKYKKKIFRDMINEIWERYKETALKINAPEEIQMEIWTKCYDELMDDMEYMEIISKQHFYPIFKKEIIMRKSFLDFVNRFNIWWDASMNKKKTIWDVILKEKIENYKLQKLPE
ncbi:RAD protein [Plasmodium gonderi]|uniref:RAD protein n=1 Tax=Plasmodium gonderi TaxID=77519 RepID=A0A1Y1JG96_PLAGO|nr:RAD protein [Plasmodium gonderi]GAW79782.1 RAD protein [Plasmodium gonderi]